METAMVLKDAYRQHCDDHDTTHGENGISHKSSTLFLFVPDPVRTKVRFRPDERNVDPPPGIELLRQRIESRVP